MASLMITRAKSRKKHKLKGREFTIDRAWACKKLKSGHCEATGVRFDFSFNGGHWNKNAPSIDRIDSNLGYTKENCQMVTLQFNIAKGQWSNIEMLEMCRQFVNNADKKLCPAMIQ